MTVLVAWDDAKNQINRRKHGGVKFEIAAEVFLDPFRMTTHDRIEGGEMRRQTVGVVRGVTLLLVAHTLVDDDEEGEPVEFVRIISARRALPRERRAYEENRNLQIG